MDRIVLDTDVSSLGLKHRLPSTVLTRLVGKQACVTFVTLGELSQWAELRQWGRRNRDALETGSAGGSSFRTARTSPGPGGGSRPPRSSGDEPGRPMTRGSPHAPSPMACRSRRSTSRIFEDFAEHEGLNLIIR